jgi:cytochrome c oxidase subunit 4
MARSKEQMNMSHTANTATDTHGHGHEDHGLAHVMPLSVLIAVFAALIVLTIITVAVTYVDLGALNIWVALGIAALKGTLVGLYFMHLRYDSPFHSLCLIGSFVFVYLFIAISLMDSLSYKPNFESPSNLVAPGEPPGGTTGDSTAGAGG